MFSLALMVALAAQPHRVAVVVGSNSAVEGRVTLRFAHHDANQLAAVLTQSGGFKADDVHVLLDPRPDAVIAALSTARTRLTEQDLLLFYYSGHADEASLYPGGERLGLEVLRGQLGDGGIGMRIGIIDACRGGAWTQAKGLSPTAPFSVGLHGLSSEGTALLASSSGLEDAHETDQLSGSFFTHHLIAGLRGAADASGDGQVTLSEAFAYANRFTVRDTATRSKMTQHPSFDLRLRGRQDVVLTTIGGDSTQLLVAQQEGPLEVVQLSTGITVVEGLPGEQILRLALPPGPYLVRRVVEGGVRSREVQVKSGEATRVDESALLLVGSSSLPSKGGGSGARRHHLLEVALGYAPFDPFLQSATVNASWSWLISKTLGWQVVHATYGLMVKTRLFDQLERDFNVQPSALLAPGWELDSAFVWSPQIFEAPGSSVFASLSVGPAIVGINSATAFSHVAPGVSFGASATWLFFKPLGSEFELGATFSIRDAVTSSRSGVMHFVNATLGVQFALGALN